MYMWEGRADIRYLCTQHSIDMCAQLGSPSAKPQCIPKITNPLGRQLPTYLPTYSQSARAETQQQPSSVVGFSLGWMDAYMGTPPTGLIPSGAGTGCSVGAKVVEVGGRECGKEDS
jgi:hypothetical protein